MKLTPSDLTIIGLACWFWVVPFALVWPPIGLALAIVATLCHGWALLKLLRGEVMKPDTLDTAILSAIRSLGDTAYGVTIRQATERALGRSVSYGALYVALERLETAGKVRSFSGDPTPERGNRPKRYYQVIG